MAALDLGDFPLSSSRVPDAETQAKAFLTKHPDFDGRGIVIGVLDTGCDPGAPGLKMTTDGKPKIIDCVDCTGSGDVDTSVVVEAFSGLVQSPLSNRTLTLGTGSKWSNPSGKWHVGVKKAYELYDESLVERIKKERHAAFDKIQRAYMAEARKNVTASEQSNAKPVGDAARTHKDLEEKAKELAALEQACEDEGPIIDVVAWNDGTTWRAAIGMNDDGDLSNSPAMASFSKEYEFESLGAAEQLNYCLNITDDGNVVSIVCDISSHGTHVAGIAAAHHPEQPEMNGVAPGAQIVSCKIGDTRLDGMETGTGLARAFAHCIKAKVDLINLSFGEPSSPNGVGRVIEIAKRMVSQHGIIFVTSAGNDGPALSTVGAPGNASQLFITVGAHVSPPAMEAQYSMLEKLSARPYTWTSRGPTQDGSLGAIICAPGSAITSIPNWTLSGAQLMNGTSMASPNACGCLALVLSGLKASGVAWSPPSIRQASQSTALSLPSADPFAVGAGMIQVDACYEYLTANADLYYRDVTIAASVLGRGRGIYLREPHEVGSLQSFTAKIDPQFKEFDSSLNRTKIELTLNVAVTSTASWVKVPPYVVIPGAGRTFPISVDPNGLAEGEVHLAHIYGYDSSKPKLGPIFRIPVTVVRPMAPTCCPMASQVAVLKRPDIRCSPGVIVRNFVAIPPGATWAEFTLTAKAFTGGPRLMILHVIQDLPHVPYSKSGEEFILRYSTAGVQTKTLRVEGNGTLEVTLAQMWNNLGDTDLDLEISFSGVVPEVSTLSLSTGNPVASVFVMTGPGAVSVKPTATLNTHRSTIRPSSAIVKPCGERDLYPEGKRVYELIMEYPFKMEEDGEATPQAMLLNDRLYESVFEAQLVTIYDRNKRYVGCTDCWPKPVKLKKGDHVARLQVRHDDVSLLEKLKSFPMCLDRPLSKAITIKAFPDYGGAVLGQGEFGTQQLKGGVRKAIFFAPAVDEKFPDVAKPGDLLLGPVSFGEPAVKPLGKKTRGGFTVQFAVTAPKAEEKKDEAKEEDTRSNKEKLDQAILDAKLQHLEGLRKSSTKDEYDFLLRELLEKQPKHLPLHQERLRGAEEFYDGPKNMFEKEKDAETEKKEKEQLESIVKAADALIEVVDLDAVAAHLGKRVDKEDKDAVKRGKELEKARDAVVDALMKKVLALARHHKREAREASEVSTAYKMLEGWVDISEAKYGRVTAAYERAGGRCGLALAAMTKYIGAEASVKRELIEEKITLLEELGWKAWAEREQRNLTFRFPKAYTPF